MPMPMPPTVFSGQNLSDVFKMKPSDSVRIFQVVLLMRWVALYQIAGDAKAEQIPGNYSRGNHQ